MIWCINWMVSFDMVRDSHYAVLLEKIDGINQKIDSQRELLETKLHGAVEDIATMKKEVKKNTEMRLNVKGVVGAIAFICTATGSGIFALYLKISEWLNK